MLGQQRKTILALILGIVSLNVLYFMDVFGDTGIEIYHTVKVKVEAVTEEAIGTGNEAWESVKSWTLWDPLEWADDGGGEGPVEDDDDEVLRGNIGELGAEGDPGITDDGVGDVAEEASITKGDEATVIPEEEIIPGQVEEDEATTGEGEVVDETSETNQTSIEEFGEAPGNDTKGKGRKKKTRPGHKGTEKETAMEEAQEDKPLTLPQLCNKTQWTPGLFLECHSRCGVNHTSVCGGLNNARNRVQTCLRVAIDAGATLILPSATTRAKGADTQRGLRNINFATVPTEQFWDVEELKRRLHGYTDTESGDSIPGVCEQLKVREWDNSPEIEKKRRIVAPFRHYVDPPIAKGRFRTIVDATLQNHGLNRADISEENPVQIQWADPFIGWNYEKSNEMGSVRSSLFSALPFNKDLMALGANVLDSPELADGFMGIHLRGEKDWPAGFGRLGLQMKLYIHEIHRINARKPPSSRVKTLYVSCGNQAAIETFRRNVKRALGEEYTVVDKVTLLRDRPNLLEAVENLSFDEKAIVEYKTLVESRYFLGLITSTMSNLIAYARTADHYADTGKDFFEDVVFKGNVKRRHGMRLWRAPKMKGAGGTRMLVLSARDIMRSFP